MKNTDLSKKKLVKEGMGGIVCFIFMVFLFSPLELYVSNLKEFNFAFRSIGWILLCSGGCFVVLIGVALLVMPIRLGKMVVITFSITDILFYLQYFINGRMGLLDGTDQYSTAECYMNFAVWIVTIGILVGLLLIIEKRTAKGMSYILYMPYAIIVMQLIASISLIVSLKNSDLKEQWMFTNEDELKVSSEENVLVLVLDCFSNEVIPQLQAEYPESLECLKDFVFFDNANSVYEATFMSLTYMLTGVEYDTTCSYLDWGDNAWGGERFKNICRSLNENNYRMKIYSTDILGCRNPKNIADKVDNYERVEIIQNSTKRLNLIKVFLRSSFYKYMPLGLKEYFYISDEMFNVNSQVDKMPIQYNQAYYSALINEGLEIDSDTNNNYFIVEHIRGLHPPYYNDEKGRYVEGGERIPAARGCMLIVNEYITQLKNLGVYDNSTIIVMSDHGNQMQSQGVQPIFFIKVKNRTSEEMEVCSSPISYEDIMPTILKEVGESNGEKTVFDYDNDRNRERRMYIRGCNRDAEPVKRSISGGTTELNVLYKYTYIIDEDNLVEQAKKHNYEKILLSEYPD